MSNLVTLNLVLLSLFLGDVSHATAAAESVPTPSTTPADTVGTTESVPAPTTTPAVTVGTTESVPTSTTTPAVTVGKSAGPVECGVRPTASRIIGGDEAKPHSWPWQCALLYNNKLLCGCSVVTHEWVITAAHCKFYKRRSLSIQRMVVLVGAHVLYSKNESLQRRYEIQEAVVHEKYLSQTPRNDIMLLRLKSNIEFNDDVQPICVDASVFPPESRCYVTGWGNTVTRGFVASSVLKQLVVRTISSDDCRRADWYGQSYDEPTMLCAGYAAGGRDACVGDSGGPLQCPGPNGRWKLIGVVSWGKDCALAKKPGVYTRVANFIDWIKQRVQDLPYSRVYGRLKRRRNK